MPGNTRTVIRSSSVLSAPAHDDWSSSQTCLPALLVSLDSTRTYLRCPRLYDERSSEAWRVSSTPRIGLSARSGKEKTFSAFKEKQMRHLRKMKSLAFSAAFLVAAVTLQPLITSTVLAQSSKGIIVGTTKDSSGAVVGGATIKITNKATNTSRETTTTSEGGYRLDAVDPGSYKIEA